MRYMFYFLPPDYMKGGEGKNFVCTFISKSELLQTYDRRRIKGYSQTVQVCSRFITMIIKCQLK
jgi:hypothetical protein